MNPKPLILVVDDNENIRAFVVLALKSAGYRAEGVPSALDCVSTARRERPDLILMDVMMPGMDGATAASAMRETAELQSIPIAFLSALPEEEVRALVAETGAAGYVTKPFRRESILRVIRSILAEPKVAASA